MRHSLRRRAKVPVRHLEGAVSAGNSPVAGTVLGYMIVSLGYLPVMGRRQQPSCKRGTLRLYHFAITTCGEVSAIRPTRREHRGRCDQSAQCVITPSVAVATTSGGE